ncbi:MAG: 2-C-methyl-D-erythritol 4-phosphate cytidylyltransferase [Desulfobacteraceae bacterium]|nr:MAG: 2-C-methyl-D-erythritol 4-phosphate cytidylyltransferase [Desulfobacteraceae bacterium]
MIAALIVAAGKGVRMGTGLRKQYLSLGGQTILAHTLKKFDQCPMVDHIVMAVPQDEMAFCRREIIDPLRMRAHTELVAGGARRQDSVCNGLDVLTEEGIVLIHDGVRPLVSRNLIEACIQGAQRWDACIPVLGVTDTLKKINPQGHIEATVPREGLCMAQTPQAFRATLIKQVHQTARRNGWTATDDASLVERAGGVVHVISGSPINIKITTPDDLRWAETLLGSQFDL